MFISYLLFSISLFFVTIHAQNNNNINKLQQSVISMKTSKFRLFFFLFSFIDIAEHEPSDSVATDSDNPSWQKTTERILIR